ncbi:MAG: heat-inducible transcriptional repressor HrcA [Clostridiales bacterium]|nr:heat-inducible transcriptional repressor HrcA [Clostridiales bacterium]
MDLSGRKIKILEAIITDYIKTGDPVGSRTISKRYPLGISSATIRNEMSDLEEMGLICQPHTSAGRVPSDKGYRLYVDRLMRRSALSAEESLFLRELITANISHIDYLMGQTAKALARMTNYATVVTEAKADNDTLKHISLVPVDSHSLVLVRVAKSNRVDNTILRAETIPDFDVLHRITSGVNKYIETYGTEVDREAVSDILKEFKPYRELLAEVFKAMFTESSKSSEIYTSGVNNILNYPEFSDIAKAKNLFSILEQKEILAEILNYNPGSGTGVQVIIGGENNLKQLKDLSVIKTNYTLGSGNVGFIGIIGPTRMNYQQAVSVLSEMVENLNEVIKALTGGQ